MPIAGQIPARFRLVSSPPGGQAAIGVIEVSAGSAPELDFALSSAGIDRVDPGRWALRALGRGQHADRGVVVRVGDRTAWLMPHAGPAVVGELLRALADAGLRPLDQPSYPEAASAIEATMLGVLAGAASPLAVDLLLDQPRRWGGLDPAQVVARADAPTRERWRTLRRLIDPPLVVAWGAPNIGKSSLLNALASATVALAADERGTTRDHVGATLDLAGLLVWYADTPGVGVADWASIAPEHGGDPLAQAQAAAREVAGRADLILLCADATSDFAQAPTPSPGAAAPAVVRVALRSDLGAPPPPRDGADVDLALSLVGPDVQGRTLELAGLIRDRLVPPAALSHPGPWAFWDGGG